MTSLDTRDPLLKATDRAAYIRDRENAVAAERERCAKIAEGWIRLNVIPDTIGAAESRAGRLIAAEIRDQSGTR